MQHGIDTTSKSLTWGVLKKKEKKAGKFNVKPGDDPNMSPGGHIFQDIGSPGASQNAGSGDPEQSRREVRVPRPGQRRRQEQRNGGCPPTATKGNEISV